MGHHQAPREPESLLRQGLLLEYATLIWNVVGTALLLATAMAAHSVALLGFGLDSLIEIGASTVVVWQLRDKGGKRQRRSLQVISVSFVALAIYPLFSEAPVTFRGYGWQFMEISLGRGNFQLHSTSLPRHLHFASRFFREPGGRRLFGVDTG